MNLYWYCFVYSHCAKISKISEESSGRDIERSAPSLNLEVNAAAKKVDALQMSGWWILKGCRFGPTLMVTVSAPPSLSDDVLAERSGGLCEVFGLCVSLGTLGARWAVRREFCED